MTRRSWWTTWSGTAGGDGGLEEGALAGGVRGVGGEEGEGAAEPVGGGEAVEDRAELVEVFGGGGPPGELAGIAEGGFQGAPSCRTYVLYVRADDRGVNVSRSAGLRGGAD